MQVVPVLRRRSCYRPPGQPLPARRSGALGAAGGVPSAPGSQFGSRSSPKEPGHQFTLVRPVDQAIDEPRQRTIHQTARPVGWAHARAQIDEVYLDLAPTPERQQRNRMLPPGDSPNGPSPNIVRARLEQFIQPDRPADDVFSNLRRRSLRPSLDLCVSAGGSSCVLLDDLRPQGTFNASAHRLSVPCHVREHVAHRPTRE